jgi:hypothetical protein
MPHPHSNGNTPACWVSGFYTAASKKYYLTAAPQCVYPDAFLGNLLLYYGNLFDYISVQVSAKRGASNL